MMGNIINSNFFPIGLAVSEKNYEGKDDPKILYILQTSSYLSFHLNIIQLQNCSEIRTPVTVYHSQMFHDLEIFSKMFDKKMKLKLFSVFRLIYGRVWNVFT